MTGACDCEHRNLQRQVAWLLALVVEMKRRRTTGGLPPPYTRIWQRGTLPAPPSAADPTAPPLQRNLTPRRSPTP